MRDNNNHKSFSAVLEDALVFPTPGAGDQLELAQLISGVLVDPHVFETSLARVNELDVPVDALLVQEGLMSETAYFQRLAEAVGVRYIDGAHVAHLKPAWSERAVLQKDFISAFSISTADGVAIVPWGLGPTAVHGVLHSAHHVLANQLGNEHNLKIVLTSPCVVKQAFLQQHQEKLVAHAADHLSVAEPQKSAKLGLYSWQKLVLIFSILGILISYQSYPFEVAFAVSVVFALFFFLLISLRLGACFMRGQLLRAFNSGREHHPDNLQNLPVYTILVPLFKEAHMLPQLVEALNNLTYPPAKLDIKLLLEEADPATLAAVKQMHLPPHYEVLIVPHFYPLTKPKALNYGLQFAKGEFVVIFDAEDIPEPDQLMRALVLFHQNGERLATVQAKLNFYNPRQNWLTKQFTIEYCSLFDGMLPAYSIFGLPLPLGGTSNHFRTHILREVEAWDAYNVTEDADLGMRLYRCGYSSLVLPSTTYEEACSGFKNWFWQRTRWLKGWMQTYYVHMRNPFQLYRDLGCWKFLGFQAIIGGPIFSALVHPVFLGVLLWQMTTDTPLDNLSLIGLWVLSLFNLSVGYIATMWLGLITLKMRQYAAFAFGVLTIPIYWILISFAAYRALVQLIYAPFYWEKTEHTARK